MSNFNIEAGFDLFLMPDFYNPTRCTIHSRSAYLRLASTEPPNALIAVGKLEAEIISASAFVTEQRTAVVAARKALAESDKDNKDLINSKKSRVG
jgi:hypothetical protein